MCGPKPNPRSVRSRYLHTCIDVLYIIIFIIYVIVSQLKHDGDVSTKRIPFFTNQFFWVDHTLDSGQP